MKTLTALTLGTMFLALPLAAQVQPPGAASVLGSSYGPSIAARQASPAEAGYQKVASTVVPNPMLLDISLGAYGGQPSLLDMNPKNPRFLGGTAAFVVDDAHLEGIEITKDHYPWRYELTIKPTIKPEIPGRIVSLTMAIVSSGQEIERQTWNVDTQGILDQGWIVPAQGAPCTEFHFQFTEQQFRAMFDGGQAPLLRVIMDVR
jgi:hypothetical protein